MCTKGFAVGFHFYFHEMEVGVGVVLEGGKALYKCKSITIYHVGWGEMFQTEIGQQLNRGRRMTVNG